MSAVRHVLRSNTWELQCPVCQRMVPIDREIFTGQKPFRAHTAWRSSSQRVFERYGMKQGFQGRIWFLIRRVIHAETWLRAVTARFEPLCPYRETVAWNRDQWPASGVDAFGPSA